MRFELKKRKKNFWKRVSSLHHHGLEKKKIFIYIYKGRINFGSFIRYNTEATMNTKSLNLAVQSNKKRELLIYLIQKPTKYLSYWNLDLHILFWFEVGQKGRLRKSFKQTSSLIAFAFFTHCLIFRKVNIHKKCFE